MIAFYNNFVTCKNEATLDNVKGKRAVNFREIKNFSVKQSISIMQRN